MNTLEKQKTPQTQKPYEYRSQDHGSAASQRGHIERVWDRHETHARTERLHADMLRAALMDFTDEEVAPTAEQLEDAADLLLAADGSAEEASAIDSAVHNDDRFMTPEDFGIPTIHEIGKRQAHLAMAMGEPDFADDDLGDDDFNSHIRIRNKL